MATINFIKRLAARPTVKTGIFRLSAPLVNEKTLLAVARQLKLTGDRTKGVFIDDNETITYKELQYRITISKLSGGIQFVDEQRWQVDDGVANITFDEKKAVNIANAFISQSKIVPLQDTKLLKVSRLSVGSQEKGKSATSERVIDYGVVYQRYIGGIPVEGPGGKLIIYINAEEKVTGFEKIWREIQVEYKPVPSLELKEPKLAESLITRYFSTLKQSLVDVHETRFGYFESGKNEKQLYLQPAYVMPYTLKNDDNRILMNSVYVTYAALKPMGKIVYPSKILFQQPKRS